MATGKAPEFALLAFEALAAGNVAAAVAAWTTPLDDRDVDMPEWRAVILNNSALGCLLSGDIEQARRDLDHAAEFCAGVLANADAPADVCGTSSGFHFRLAAKHAASFATASATRPRLVAEAISALIALHRAIALRPPASVDGARDALVRADGQAGSSAQLFSARSRRDICAAYGSRARQLRQLMEMPPVTKRAQCELALAATGIVTPAILAGLAASPALQRHEGYR